MPVQATNPDRVAASTPATVSMSRRSKEPVRVSILARAVDFSFVPSNSVAAETRGSRAQIPTPPNPVGDDVHTAA